MKIETAPVAQVTSWAASQNWEARGIVTGEYATRHSTEGLLAFEGGEIVGGALIRSADRPMLVGVYITPTSRRHGIGRALSTTAVERLLSCGHQTIVTEACDERALLMLGSMPAAKSGVLSVIDARRDG